MQAARVTGCSCSMAPTRFLRMDLEAELHPGNADHAMLALPTSSDGIAMSKLSAKISEEVGKLLPPTIYFFVALHIVAIVRALLLKGAGLPVNSSISIAVAALVLGKAVLLADMLPFINLYPAKPLAYNVAWKTALYFFAALAIHYVEHLIDYWREAGSFAAGNRELLAHI